MHVPIYNNLLTAARDLYIKNNHRWPVEIASNNEKMISLENCPLNSVLHDNSMRRDNDRGESFACGQYKRKTMNGASNQMPIMQDTILLPFLVGASALMLLRNDSCIAFWASTRGDKIENFSYHTSKQW